MSDQIEEQEVEIEDPEAQIDNVDLTEGEAETEEETPEAEEVEEDGEFSVVIEGEEEATQEDKPAPEWVKELRRKAREDKRRIRELEAQLKAKEPAPDEALPKKPEPADVDFDLEKHEQNLLAWYEKKRQHDDRQRKKQEEQERANQEWQDKLASYQEARTKIPADDYEDAEEVVQEALSVTQQGMILQGAENPALLVLALGRNPKKAKELAEITDPVKFAFAVAKLETKLKPTTKKPASKPEKVLSGGTGRASGSIDSTLERLRAEAAKTGDMSKVMAYKRQMRK